MHIWHDEGLPSAVIAPDVGPMGWTALAWSDWLYCERSELIIIICIYTVAYDDEQHFSRMTTL